MSGQFCEQGAAIVRAARLNEWDPTLRAHLDSCADCRETAKVVAAMNPLVLAESSQIPSTPDPRLLWLKASFAERQRRSALITRIAGVAYAVLAAVLGFGIYSFVNSGFTDDVIVVPVGELSASSISPFMVVLVSILLALLLSTPAHRQSR